MVALASAIYVAAIGGAGIRTSLSGRSFGWRQPLGIVLVGVAALRRRRLRSWWVVTGSGGPLTAQHATGTPAYIVEAARNRAMDGTLRLEGSSDSSFTYVLQRGELPGLGAEAILPSAADQAALTQAVADLTSDVSASDVEALASFGVRFIYLPPPADPRLSADLDAATSELGSSSAPRAGSRAWELQPTSNCASIDRQPDPPRLDGRPQLSGIVVVLVLAAPSRKKAS